MYCVFLVKICDKLYFYGTEIMKTVTFSDTIPIMEVEEKETLPLKNGKKHIFNGAIELPQNGHLDKYESIKDIEDPENKQIEKEEPKEIPPMSILRKICFFFSLNILALYFLVFAWLLPCNVKVTNKPDGLKSNGSLFLKDIEITSNIDLVFSTKTCCPLIFGYKRSNKSDVFGIAAVNATTGNFIWQTQVDDSTTYINCKLADAFHDNVTDCIAVTKEGRVGFLRGSNGNVSWFHPGVRTANRGTPVLLPGCDSPSAHAVLIPSSDWIIKENIYASLISLPSGEIVGSPVKLSVCESIPQVMLWNYSLGQNDVLFLCQVGDTSVLYKIPFSNLCELTESTSNFKDFDLVLKIKNSKGNAIMKQVPVANFAQPDLLAYSGSAIFLLDGKTLKQKSLLELPRLEILKDVNYGTFKNPNSSELIMITEVSSGLQISFIDLIKGKVLDYPTFIPVTGSLTASQIISGVHRDTDVILLQMIVGNGSSSSCDVDLSISQMNIDKEPQELSGTDGEDCLEKFILADLSNNTFMTVLEHEMPIAGTAAVEYVDSAPVLISAGIAPATNSSSDISKGTRIEIQALSNSFHNSSCNCEFAEFGQETFNNTLLQISALKKQIIAKKVDMVQKLFAHVSVVY